MNVLNILTTRDKSVAKRRFWAFLAIWFVMSSIQCIFSGYNEDEPYYYIYALYPAWGYFDHPPMVGMFVKMGIALLGKVGVRLFAAVSSTVFLWAVWRVLEYKEKWRYVNVYILLALSIPMVNVYGFVLVPDAPLLLFSALFLYVYKRFLYSRSVTRAVLMGLLAAAMLYSKYHGALLLLLVILSNLQLLRNKYFYIALLVAGLCFMPHVVWQIENDFPSLKYHLVQRSAKEYQFLYTWEYPLNQLAVLGPFTLPMMLIAVFKSKARTTLSRAMRFIFWGFLGFFLIMTFKGHVEPHWTIVAVIPGVYFCHPWAVQNETRARFFLFGTLFAAVLIFIARILLLIPGLPTPYHNQDKWAGAIEEVAGDSPVVFRDSYQKPSMYIIMTDKTAWTYNSPTRRSNQYDFLPIIDSINGKKVLYLGEEPHTATLSIITPDGDTLHGRWIENFCVDSVRVDDTVEVE